MRMPTYSGLFEEIPTTVSKANTLFLEQEHVLKVGFLFALNYKSLFKCVQLIYHFETTNKYTCTGFSLTWVNLRKRNRRNANIRADIPCLNEIKMKR
jgi:hypothetical protein